MRRATVDDQLSASNCLHMLFAHSEAGRLMLDCVTYNMTWIWNLQLSISPFLICNL